MTRCPINPKDYIDAPYGAFVKAVRAYDPDYGRSKDKKKKFVIEYKEIRTETITHQTDIEAYTYEDAVRKIENDDLDGFIDDKEVDFDSETEFDYFEEVSSEELDK